MGEQQVSEDNRSLARYLDTVFGGDQGIAEYSDQAERTWINVLSSPDRPDQGLISFATIGLSDHLQRAVTHPPLGREIVAVSPDQAFADVIAAAGFHAVRNGWTIEPGVIILGVVGERIDDTTVPHLLFVEPFLWDDDPAPQVLSAKTVDWVLGVPASTAEMEYLRQHGFSALEDRFDEAQPDLFDLRRRSAV